MQNEAQKTQEQQQQQANAEGQKPAEKPAEEVKKAEQKPAEDKKPEEQKPAEEKKPAEQPQAKPEEQKPAEKQDEGPKEQPKQEQQQAAGGRAAWHEYDVSKLISTTVSATATDMRGSNREDWSDFDLPKTQEDIDRLMVGGRREGETYADRWAQPGARQ